MGRSYTPFELHRDDLQYHFSKDRLIFKYPTNEDVHVIYDPEAEIVKKYPNLQFLLDVSEIVERYKDRADKVLEKVESTLSKLISEIDSGTFKEKDLKEEEEVIFLWYVGKLDKDFYYGDYNASLFKEYIVSLMEGKSEEWVNEYKSMYW